MSYISKSIQKGMVFGNFLFVPSLLLLSWVATPGPGGTFSDLVTEIQQTRAQHGPSGMLHRDLHFKCIPEDSKAGV